MNLLSVALRFLIPTLVFICVDFYIFYALRHIYGNSNYWVFFRNFFWLSVILFVVGVVVAFLVFNTIAGGPTFITGLIVGVAFAVIISKTFFASLLLGEDIIRFFYSIIKHQSLSEFPDRHSIYNFITIGISVFIFFAVIYGTIIGKYDYKVHRYTLTFDNLPPQFDGYKIVQLSDIHCGSFDNLDKVREGVALVNQQNPDLILFTGDFVNSQSSEAIPYIPIFSELKAKDGMYCVIGNHDYAHYSRMSPREQLRDLAKLKEYHAKIGFKVLDNKSAVIHKNSDSIYIVGVENWGLPPFPQRGNLKSAIKGLPNDAFSILLSHDPSHWDEKILTDLHFVELTLSGHTHGMQFGIDLPFFQWSPVQWKYPRWAGLYKEHGKYLYVNRGFGFIGMPARVGVRPEITLIELQRKKQ